MLPDRTREWHVCGWNSISKLHTWWKRHSTNGVLCKDVRPSSSSLKAKRKDAFKLLKAKRKDGFQDRREWFNMPVLRCCNFPGMHNSFIDFDKVSVRRPDYGASPFDRKPNSRLVDNLFWRIRTIRRDITGNEPPMNFWSVLAGYFLMMISFFSSTDEVRHMIPGNCCYTSPYETFNRSPTVPSFKPVQAK